MRRRRTSGADGTTGYPNRRGARLEKFQEDAARRGDRNGRRSRASSGSGIGNGAATRGTCRRAYTQDANVPYLAWRGEHVRLGFCDAEHAVLERRHGQLGARGLERRSGQRLDAGAARDRSARVRSSAAASYTDLDLAEGRRRIHQAHRARRRARARAHLREAVHRRLDGAAQADRAAGGGDVNAGDFCESRSIETLTRRRSSCSGRIANCCTPTRVDPRHRMQIIVKGNLPLEADFSEWGLGDHLTLPDDWGRWAAVAARSTTDQSDPLKAMTNWDIHDDSLHDRGSRHRPAACSARLEDEPREIYTTSTRSTTAPAPARAGGFSTVFGSQSTRRPHDRPVRSDLPVRHDALRRQGRRG